MSESAAADKPAPVLTRGYIKALSEFRSDISEAFVSPILQVSQRETKFRNSGFSDDSFKNGDDSNTIVPMQITHLTLVDGDGNSMLDKAAIHLTHEARTLNEGDIIKINLLTELSYKIGGSDPLPGIVILDFSSWICCSSG